jgi:tetratricopeptide (TPR) repeat protein
MTFRAGAGTVRVALVTVGLAVAVTPVWAQTARTQSATHAQLLTELGRLRQASALETNGDLPGAEALVRGVLETNPTSLTALLTLERLLSAQGRTQEISGPIDRLLAQDPSSVVGHQTRLRIRAQLNDQEALETAAQAWIRAMPKVETPYREVALVWRQRGDYARAIAVLEQGRKRIDRPDALAIELGDTYLAAGDLPRAAAEWARAIGSEGRGFLLVQRRLQNLPDGGARLLPLLVDQLATPPRKIGRLRAATLLSIDAGLAPRAERLAAELVAAVPVQEKEAVLVELARRADGAGLYRLAAWSYDALLRQQSDPGAALAIHSRLAELALLTGDTATAAQRYQELEKAAAAGSPQRRQALALQIQLTSREGGLERAEADLARLQAEYPQAPELDATASEVAEHYLRSGDVAGAERVLGGVTGARAARLRGRVALVRGDIQRAREELLSAAPLLHGAEATATIALASLLVRLSPAGGELLARVVGASAPDRERELRAAAQQAATLPDRECTAILDFLAGVADGAGLLEDADGLRRQVITNHPQAQEAPAALLALARSALAKQEPEEARVLLEKLIMEYPRSALMPQARRELERLGRI